jgi:cell division protein FtsB
MGLFKGLTIDGIIADITAKIEKLHFVAEAHAAFANLKAEEEKLAAEARKFAEDEYARAKALTAKFESLVKV